MSARPAPDPASPYPYEIVRKLPDGAQVSLETGADDGQLQLRSGRSRFNLQSLPESDFPDLAAGEMTHKFKLAAGDPTRPLDKTQFAISNEETRYYLNGVFMHVAEIDEKPSSPRGGDRWAQWRGWNAARRRERHARRDVPRKGAAEVFKLIDTGGRGRRRAFGAKIRFTLARWC